MYRPYPIEQNQFGSVVFDADNITLNCNGKQVHISSYSKTNCDGKRCAIVAQGKSNITIKNCSIVGGFDRGIMITDSTGATVRDTTINGPRTGVRIMNSSYPTILNTDVGDPGTWFFGTFNGFELFNNDHTYMRECNAGNGVPDLAFHGLLVQDDLFGYYELVGATGNSGGPGGSGLGSNEGIVIAYSFGTALYDVYGGFNWIGVYIINSGDQ